MPANPRLELAHRQCLACGERRASHEATRTVWSRRVRAARSCAVRRRKARRKAARAKRQNCLNSRLRQRAASTWSSRASKRACDASSTARVPRYACALVMIFWWLARCVVQPRTRPSAADSGPRESQARPSARRPRGGAREERRGPRPTAPQQSKPRARAPPDAGSSRAADRGLVGQPDACQGPRATGVPCGRQRRGARLEKPGNARTETPNHPPRASSTNNRAAGCVGWSGD